MTTQKNSITEHLNFSASLYDILNFHVVKEKIDIKKIIKSISFVNKGLPIDEKIKMINCEMTKQIPQDLLKNYVLKRTNDFDEYYALKNEFTKCYSTAILFSYATNQSQF